MMLRCDHCREKLGDRVQHYWHMRFCSEACMQAYQHRLKDETRAKIRRLDCKTRTRTPIDGRRPGLGAIDSHSRHFPG